MWWLMPNHQQIDASVAVALNRLFPGFEEKLVTQSSPEGDSKTFLELPPASGADYRFLLFFKPEVQIHAKLFGADQKQYFWYMPFEEDAYPKNLERLQTEFIVTVERLVLNPTRIVQRRGLLSDSFKLECQWDGKWHPVYRHSCFRFAFTVPPIRGRLHVYLSPPVVPHETP